MCQKLQTFLKENKANFTIKYDSERVDKNYTVVLFDTEKGESICSRDTDSIDIVENEIMKTLNAKIDFTKINQLFYEVKAKFLTTKTNYFIVGIYQTKDSLDYRISIFGEMINIRETFSSLEELERFIKNND
ncbi:hypothetical protein QJV14_12405 [Listeria cossartiae subsp. cayugensis]|uniref:hypothetical protein n=1 Tax=Listeria cossartiae TaxID=2838249 RepID=UPI0028805B89|nr:hypothetical protein [Listeria cossartiae]MDT0001621.1 hypothetical protein [Listeria cossartiae subsp. cayugensis]MDT0004411.1 hypothetical protein [Listeria cossartiae subsp. cayugensis]MDT0009820.1 hypothetical protein [Listeria cossartiae subsp. cayugensis]MDT0015341.1 hypothetical protein [Listeria cossartiae subsp. cayugensis]MDT0020748.1 hypothetical protein [Listeria cossartiae subsp. cayugensis]